MTASITKTEVLRAAEQATLRSQLPHAYLFTYLSHRVTKWQLDLPIVYRALEEHPARERELSNLLRNCQVRCKRLNPEGRSKLSEATSS